MHVAASDLSPSAKRAIAAVKRYYHALPANAPRSRIKRHDSLTGTGAHFGLSRETVRNIVNGTHIPQVRTVKQILEVAKRDEQPRVVSVEPWNRPGSSAKSI